MAAYAPFRGAREALEAVAVDTQAEREAMSSEQEQAAALYEKICAEHDVKKFLVVGCDCLCGVTYAGDIEDHRIETFAGIMRQRGFEEAKKFLGEVATFLEHWAKHTKEIHNIGCSCRYFEKQAHHFIVKIRELEKP